MRFALGNRRFIAIIFLSILGIIKANAQSSPTILVDVDHRQSISLNGDWHTIIDPYFNGLYTFHHEIRNDGFFLNGTHHLQTGEALEYDFSKSPTLKVPGDWNTQRESLFHYEGLIWYQRDFDNQPREHHRAFFHIGAANYKAILWVNGTQV